MNVFGFGLNKAGEYKHYYSNKESSSIRKPGAKPGSAHDMKLEADLRQKLADEGLILVYPGVIR